MFVTLLKDVKGLGKKTERVRVSDAYARNVIIPQSMGVVGEQSSFTLEKKTQTQALHIEQVQRKLALGLCLSKEANDKGGLYEKLTEKQCLKEVSRLLEIGENRIKLQKYEPIHQIGTQSIHFLIEGNALDLTVTIQPK